MSLDGRHSWVANTVGVMAEEGEGVCKVERGRKLGGSYMNGD
jgi:hypothetical protein